MYVIRLINVEKQETDEERVKTYHFERVEILTGISGLDYTQITPVNKLEESATIVRANAFYLASMSTDHSEHGH